MEYDKELETYKSLWAYKLLKANEILNDYGFHLENNYEELTDGIQRICGDIMLINMFYKKYYGKKKKYYMIVSLQLSEYHGKLYLSVGGEQFWLDYSFHKESDGFDDGLLKNFNKNKSKAFRDVKLLNDSLKNIGYFDFV